MNRLQAHIDARRAEKEELEREAAIEQQIEASWRDFWLALSPMNRAMIQTKGLVEFTRMIHEGTYIRCRTKILAQLAEGMNGNG